MMRFPISLLIATLVFAAPVLARPVRMWTQQELFDESDLVAIVTADEPTPVPNTHEFVTRDKHMNEYLRQHESELKVLAVLKGERDLKTVTLIHFLKRDEVKWGMGNGPTYVWMGTKLITRPNSGWDHKPQYLVYLRERPDGKFDPVTGQLDPPNSVVRMIPFPERDPAMDDIQEVPAP